MHSRSERGRRQPFHPELRLARFIPRVSITPRNLPLVRTVMRSKKARSTADVEVSTITVAGDDGPLTARLFRPRNAVDAPLIFWLHGGGLLFGQPWQDDSTNLRLATELGVVVIAPSYRLAPEHPQPAALHDVHGAYRDVLARAEEFGIDPARTVVAGASAGGTLAAGLVQRLHDEGGIQPRLQLLVYPLLDDRTVLRDDIDTRGMRGWMPKSNEFTWRAYLQREPGAKEVPPYVVPARRDDLSGLPPAWIGVGTLDLFFDEDVEYAERLRQAGVPCELEVVPGAFHGFETVFRKAKVSRAFVGSWVRAIRRAITADVPTGGGES